MKILADENVDSPIVLWLRSQGHDIIWAAESLRSEPDASLIRLATDQDRVLVTADKDFGEHVFRLGQRVPGLVLLRLQAKSTDEMLAQFQLVWPRMESQARGRYIVVSHHKIRQRPIY